MLEAITAPGEVAAILLEPLEHERAAMLPDDCLGAVRAFCDAHGVLLVLDEIRSGLGRTGRMFHSQYADVLGDMVLLADGLGGGIPIGAVLTTDAIIGCLETVQVSASGGNPVACAAALTVIELLARQYIPNSERLHNVAINRLHSIDARQKHLANPRGRGLMLAVDIVRDGRSREPDPTLRDRVVNEAFSRGLLILGCGRSSIRFTPPLCINSVQLEVGFDVFDEAVATVAD
jgi:4-aminobutyrate aminotransferase